MNGRRKGVELDEAALADIATERAWEPQEGDTVFFRFRGRDEKYDPARLQGVVLAIHDFGDGYIRYFVRTASGFRQHMCRGELIHRPYTAEEVAQDWSPI